METPVESCPYWRHDGPILVGRDTSSTWDGLSALCPTMIDLSYSNDTITGFDLFIFIARCRHLRRPLDPEADDTMRPRVGHFQEGVLVPVFLYQLEVQFCTDSI